MITFNTHTNPPRDRGSLTMHAPKTFSKGNLVELFNVLYFYDGALRFKDCDQIAKGVQLIYDHFKRFGLEIHIGKISKLSKTECVFFPPQELLKKSRHYQQWRIVRTKRWWRRQGQYKILTKENSDERKDITLLFPK